MRPAVVDLLGLALFIGLVVSGMYLMSSMMANRSRGHVRAVALVCLVITIAFMLYLGGAW